MALDQSKRQKNAEKRKAKQKARQKGLSSRKRDEVVMVLKRGATAPILHCCVQRDLFIRGMGQVILSRLLPGGDVAFGIFLLDVYCLGVKNAMSGVITWVEYQERIAGAFFKEYEFVNVKPEALRKCVEGAVTYANESGFPPHADYAKAQLIFGNIDATACEENFEYGFEGKPHFVAGPFDNEFRCQFIQSQLKKSRGPDGFTFAIPEGLYHGPMDGVGLLGDDDDFDDEFDDDLDDELL